MLTPTFRHLLYWMIESNPIQGWQDETLAVKIEELFHKLKTLIAAGKMPHYFMRKSNMLGGIPQYKLQNVNERIFRTRENFVFFLINMLKVHLYGMPKIQTLFGL